jgi:hypothetical protein
MLRRRAFTYPQICEYVVAIYLMASFCASRLAKKDASRLYQAIAGNDESKVARVDLSDSRRRPAPIVALNKCNGGFGMILASTCSS